jgi:hypothetical protein
MSAQNVVLKKIQESPLEPSVKRVERVLDLLVTAERLRGEIYVRAFSRNSPRDELSQQYDSSKEARRFPEGVLGNRPFSDPITREMNERYSTCLKELARRLKRYQSYSVVWDSDYEWLQRFPVYRAKNRQEDWEHIAVHWLLRFLDEHDFYSNSHSGLARFRRCAACSRWIFAVTDHQRFCGEECRKRNAAESPEFKKKRRIYMKERYRPQQKELQRRSLANAKSKQTREQKGTR